MQMREEVMVRIDNLTEHDGRGKHDGRTIKIVDFTGRDPGRFGCDKGRNIKTRRPQPNPGRVEDVHHQKP